MTALICTVISAILGGLIVARFSSHAARSGADIVELSSEIAKAEKQLHRLREISAQRGEMQVGHRSGSIAITSSRPNVIEEAR